MAADGEHHYRAVGGVCILRHDGVGTQRGGAKVALALLFFFLLFPKREDEAKSWGAGWQGDRHG